MKDVIIFTDPFEEYQKSLDEEAEKEAKAKKEKVSPLNAFLSFFLTWLDRLLPFSLSNAIIRKKEELGFPTPFSPSQRPQAKGWGNT